jgi:hypothetical protein
MGMPIIALTTVYGPRYKGVSGSTSKDDLMFGLPLEGTYDDYGGIDNLTHPALDALHEKAFAESGYFKKYETKNSYGGPTTQWLAAHPDTLWSLTDAIKPLYFAELGVRMSEVGAYDEASRAKMLEAFKRSEAALAQLGERLAAATFGDAEGVAQDQLFAIFEDIFGKERAWSAWHAISKEGLFAVRSQIFMHQPAYQAMVQEFGQRKVGYYQDKTRYKLRDFIAQQLDEWLETFPAEYKKMEQLFGDVELPLSPAESRRRALRYASSRRYSLLAPLTALWMAPEVPLIGHFWGGATPEEILAAVPKDLLIDYFIFQWARHYLRIDFTKPGSGSQNEEAVLPDKIFKATMKALRENNFVRKDFDGTLFR